MPGKGSPNAGWRKLPRTLAEDVLLSALDAEIDHAYAVLAAMPMDTRTERQERTQSWQDMRRLLAERTALAKRINGRESNRRRAARRDSEQNND